uniref:Immunoglobulin heavy variable 2-2 n=1 Tax=Cyprinus carpio TaxID=7962 RepID=A0A8C1JR83_CYPCA
MKNVKDLCNVIPLLPAYGFYLTHVFVNFCVLFSFTDVSGISLTSSPVQNKAPGQSVRLSCQISGYSLTDYGTVWIWQPPGKGKLWSELGELTLAGVPALIILCKNHFTMSEDVSQSTQYLKAKSLREEDTAVYYCARQTQ